MTPRPPTPHRVPRATARSEWTTPAEDLGDDLPELVGVLQGWDAALREAAAHYPSSPQEATMVDDVQRWARRSGLAAFPGVPAGSVVP